MTVVKFDYPTRTPSDLSAILLNVAVKNFRAGRPIPSVEAVYQRIRTGWYRSAMTSPELERIYREEADELWRALFAFSGDPDIADEARSEAFAQALRRGPELRSPSAWVWTASFRIARGLLKDRSGLKTSFVADSPIEMPSPVDHIVQALLALPTNQRLAIILHDYADRPVHEVAAALGTARATVYVHLSRGRRRLRALLEEDDDDRT